MHKKVLKLLLLTVLIAFYGCNNTTRTETTYYKDADKPKIVLLNDVEIIEAMANSRKVLEDKGFKIDKFDVEHGYLLTKPLSGSQFWEFWKKDNVGAHNKSMSNINNIIRTVEMNFKMLDGRIYADCAVEVGKLSFTGEPIVSATDMQEAFTESGGGLQELSLAEGNIEWLWLGRDIRLEEKILDDIRI